MVTVPPTWPESVSVSVNDTAVAAFVGRAEKGMLVVVVVALVESELSSLLPPPVGEQETTVVRMVSRRRIAKGKKAVQDCKSLDGIVILRLRLSGGACRKFKFRLSWLESKFNNKKVLGGCRFGTIHRSAPVGSS